MFLQVSFCVKHEDGFYMVYTSSDLNVEMLGHKTIACPLATLGRMWPTLLSAAKPRAPRQVVSWVVKPGAPQLRLLSASKPGLCGGVCCQGQSRRPRVRQSHRSHCCWFPGLRACKQERRRSEQGQEVEPQQDTLQDDEAEEQGKATGCHCDIDMDCESESDTACISQSVLLGEDL